MTDMLVKLYDLPIIDDELFDLAQQGISIKRAMAFDRAPILQFVDQHFRATAAGWLGECEAAMGRQPTTCFVAVQARQLIGFVCYDGSAKGFLGPFGVASEQRRRGVGRALLMSAFEAMAFDGYGYAIIGWVSSEDYYAKAVNAIAIPDSFPGVYQNLIDSS